MADKDFDGSRAQTRPSRRRILGVGALAAVGVAGCSPAAETNPVSEAVEPPAPVSVDTIIVGAGLAGLSAARRLIEDGRSVLVLEALDRVGGRVKRGDILGHTIDLGAQWVGPGQDYALNLAKELQIGLQAQFDTGPAVMVFNGRADQFDGSGAGFSSVELQDFATLVEEMERLAAAVDPGAPWEAPEAEGLDAIPVSSWMETALKTERVKSLFEATVRSVVCVETSQISLLTWAAYLAGGGGYRTVTGTSGGAQQDTLVGGAYQLPALLAAELGDAVRLGVPVRAIKQLSDGVAVEADMTYLARRVIVAVPPPMAARIQFDPPLPGARDALMQRTPMGAVIKSVIAYEKPVWRDQGLSGLVLSNQNFVAAFDKNLGSDETRGALVGFFAGRTAEVWGQMSKAARQAEVDQTVRAAFGDGLSAPLAYEDQVWRDEPFVRGCYGAVPSPGVMTSVGESLTKPIGRIHWAGTETSDVWAGYMDGALRSGERAAEEVLTAG